MTARMRLTVDAIMIATLLAAYFPSATGISLHEWVSVAMASVVLVHLAFNWEWVVGATKRWFANLPMRNAVGEVLNVLMFGATVMVVLSGFMISQAIGPIFGIEASGEQLWHHLHSLSAHATILLSVVHGALHWKWIVRATRGVFSRKSGERHAATGTATYAATYSAAPAVSGTQIKSQHVDCGTRVSRYSARAVGGGERDDRHRVGGAEHHGFIQPVDGGVVREWGDGDDGLGY